MQRTQVRVIRAFSIDYDQAADDYQAHRRIHTGVFRELCRPGWSGPSTTMLEVGCGTGNYIRALARRFRCPAFGLDASAAMLAHACAQPGWVGWVKGRAEKITFASEAFDLIFSVDVIHHVSDKASFYCQVARALQPSGRVCTVTDSHEIIRRRQVLSGYFPETVEFELARYPRLAQLEAWMATAGLVTLDVVTVEAPYEITSAQPFRDRAYSSLRLISEDTWQAGVQRLERDLASGPIRGDSRYACVWGRKLEG